MLGINTTKTEENFSIKDAINWFAGNKSALSTKIKINSELSFLNNISDFTPIWDSARTAVDTNYYAVEAPAKYLKGLGFSTDSNTNNINGLIRLLVLKYKKTGSLSAVLMHVHGDAGVNIANVHYMNIPQNFSGNIFYTNVQGAFINGYIYKSGKIVMVSSGKANTIKPTGPKILLEYIPGYCIVTTTDWYTHTCYIENDGSVERCTEWVYDYTTVEEYCVPGVYVGSGGGVSPPDCPPVGGNPPVVAESIKGKLVVKVAVPPDSTNSPCTPQPPPPVDTIVKKSLSTQPKVNCIYLNLVNNSVFKGLINGFLDGKQFNLSFNVGKLNNPSARAETSTKADYSDPNVEITINIDKIDDMSAASMAEVFLHEAYHAYIDQILIRNNLATKNGFNNSFDSDFDKYVAFEVDSTQKVYLAQGIGPSDQRWNQIQHEVIANDIDRLAKGLKEFIEKIYPEAKNDSDFTFDKYQAYAWQGLIYSQAFAAKWGTIANPAYNIKNLLNQVTNPCSQ